MYINNTIIIINVLKLTIKKVQKCVTGLIEFGEYLCIIYN